MLAGTIQKTGKIERKNEKEVRQLIEQGISEGHIKLQEVEEQLQNRLQKLEGQMEQIKRRLAKPGKPGPPQPAV